MDAIELSVQVILVFIAAFTGIPAGFWLQHLIDERKLRDERLQLLSFLEINLNKNLNLIRQIANELTSDGVIYYSLDLCSWPYVAQKISILKDPELSGRIQNTYYELLHLERKIDKQFETAYTQIHYDSENPIFTTKFIEMRKELILTGIISHIKGNKSSEGIEGLVKGSIQEIKKEIDKISNPK